MKRSYFKRKSFKDTINNGLKRTPFKKRTKIKVVGASETSDLKGEIQILVREIVIKRDGGCIFRNEPGHICTGFAKDGHLILQADHLITRSNSATYADTRLIVCVCKGIHGWKSVGSNLRKSQYDERIKKLLKPEIVELWERCEKDSWKPKRTGAYDWKMAIIILKQELKSYDN